MGAKLGGLRRRCQAGGGHGADGAGDPAGAGRVTAPMRPPR